MNTRKIFLVLFVLTASFSAASAQGRIDQIVKDWERAKEYTKSYLDAMPDDKFAFKPKPEMRSFAGQMLHLSDADYAFVSAATGETNPMKMGELEKSTKETKADVTAAVLKSYDFVISSIKKMKPEQLSEKVKLFDRFEMTKEDALNKAFEHQTHHRGQTTAYLRLAGAKPPQEQLF
ncbi:MAG: DinB family protein [Mucilaginibacter polytrichastri]|nr:DinB family protein [Mucilaginibacter polytrichastri]